MEMFEQMQAKMKQLEQENERFKLLFAGDQSDAAAGALRDAATGDGSNSAGRDSNALETGLGGSVAHTPGSLDIVQIVQFTGADPEQRLAITALVPAGLGGLEIRGER